MSLADSLLGMWLRLVCFCLLPFCLVGCDDPVARQISFSGDTMGSTYHVSVVEWPDTVEPEDIRPAIEYILALVDKDMSNYRNDSALSLFNRFPVGEWFPVSKDLYRTILLAQQISAGSRGAYDITVAPLVELWGFGPARNNGSVPPPDSPPSAQQIAAALAETGYQYLQLRDQPAPALLKQRNLHIDLSSIAAGYAADLIAGWLESKGIHRYMIDVTGEFRVSGSNAKGGAWRIGITNPANPMDPSPIGSLLLSNGGVATSGNYHQYFWWEGRQYSHTIDPRNGMAVSHDLVSVTVAMPTAAEADAWATAYSVMGLEEALEHAEQARIAVYAVSRGEGGKLSTHISPEMKGLVGKAGDRQ